MDFRLSPEKEKIKQEFWAVCRELEKKKPASYLAYESKDNDKECLKYHLYCAKEFGKRGWLSLGWPKEYGGTGDMLDKALFSEAIGYYDVPGVDIMGVGMLAPTLCAAASDEMKKRFLPGIASGEIQWCQLWSEPNAGSDLAGLKTTAIRKGDEFIINGQKIWTSGAHNADWSFGVFKSDPDGKKHRNLTFLLLDMKTKGITIRPIYFMDGSHVYNEIFLDDVHVPATNIVGNEGGGWAVVNALASFERSSITPIAGLVKLLEGLVYYANAAERNGRPLSQDPAVRNRLAQLAAELESVRMLSFRIVDQQSRKEMALMDASMVKIYASELLERFSQFGMDLMGPWGQVKNSKFAQLHGEIEYLYQFCHGFITAQGTNDI